MVNGIGEKTVEAMKKQACDLIEAHKGQIQKAFFRADEGKIKVGLGINIQQVGPKLAVETNITYVVEKVSDKVDGYIDENQSSLFAVEEVAAR